ncbi:atypical/RIO/RIO1 protein kinase [Phakopsora pachyrhizi]|uniref:non-specific serine/threonine protein kinase n=1 Tax=Phakopsora pachyrhizi TaxID=170000 RepID=A0AAV0B0T1_PHAPC|nr:atypical/RIO/RIO1 protein kinase [Phakopsora pachyrhizi]
MACSLTQILDYQSALLSKNPFDRDILETSPEISGWIENEMMLLYLAESDWEILAGGEVSNLSNSFKSSSSSTVVPPSNKSHNLTTNPSNTPAATIIRQDKLNDQLVSLSSKFSTSLSLGNLNTTQTRKGGFEPTNEQVLDPHVGKRLGGSDRGLCLYRLALKIYKTSILIFKDRDRYVTGEFRFRSGYARKNPRKMVRLWAEKELRNLKRLRERNVRCPRDDNDDWRASPRLKDAKLPEPGEGLEELYWEIVAVTRVMYQQCKLVHADLTHLFIIDVSQSVEHDHPSAFDFLRSDISNIDSFFSRTGIQTLGLKRTFEFVTQNKTSNETEEELIRDVSKILNSLKEKASTEEAVEECGNNPNDGGNEEGLTPSNSKHEEAVFKKSFIPRTLNEVYDAERDVQRVIRGEAKDLIYANLTGIVSKQDVRVIESEISDDSSLSSKSDKSLNNENFSEEDEDGLLLEDELKRRDRVNRGFKFESNEDKRERKKLVKESNRLKRQEKIPKSVKKKKISKTSGKR